MHRKLEDLKNLLDYTHLLSNISQMDIDEISTLSKIYGNEWSNVLNPTKAGKLFLELVEENVVSNIKYYGTKTNNHKLYIKVK